MQKLIDKSLRQTILEQVSQLNRANAQLYAILRKLSTSERTINETFTQRLQGMRGDIKEKVRQLAGNVDLMYQVMDRKLAIVIGRLSSSDPASANMEEQLRVQAIKIRELQQQIRQTKNKLNAVVVQNEFLKNKNISLVQQIETLSRKKANTATNDSSQNLNPAADLTNDSLDGHVSPLQQPIRPSNSRNDLTFNNMGRETSSRKKIRSEQNSFSSELIMEQNSFREPKISEKVETSRLNFGCMPVRQAETGLNFKGTSQKLNGSEVGHMDESHRLNFLINNLKDSMEQSNYSTGSHGHKLDQEQSVNKSVLSRGVVKKYHI